VEEELWQEDAPVGRRLLVIFLQFAGSDLLDDLGQDMVKLLEGAVLFRIEVVHHHEGRTDHDGVGQQDLKLLGLQRTPVYLQQEDLQVALLEGGRPDVDASVPTAAELGSESSTWFPLTSQRLSTLSQKKLFPTLRLPATITKAT
jgi:hypothetical protein